jgi:hypothetical protein
MLGTLFLVLNFEHREQRALQLSKVNNREAVRLKGYVRSLNPPLPPISFCAPWNVVIFVLVQFPTPIFNIESGKLITL